MKFAWKRRERAVGGPFVEQSILALMGWKAGGRLLALGPLAPCPCSVPQPWGEGGVEGPLGPCPSGEGPKGQQVFASLLGCRLASGALSCPPREEASAHLPACLPAFPG